MICKSNKIITALSHHSIKRPYSYAPVLRPLRPLAKLVRFSPVMPNAVVGRLRTICDAESLSADNKSLTALATAAEGDLRTCLNTLQVGPPVIQMVPPIVLSPLSSSSRRKRQQSPKAVSRGRRLERKTRAQALRWFGNHCLNEAMIARAKTVSFSFQIIFFSMCPLTVSRAESDPGQYVDRLVKHISTCGEYDKIVQGITCFHILLCEHSLTL